MIRTIHHTFGPHVTARFFLRSLWILLRPWSWKTGKSTVRLQQELENRLQGTAFLYASGREALLATMKAMNIRSGEEIIVQGYTCVVVPNAIHAAGGTVVYADIDETTLNLNIDAVKNAITPRTRAVICQHTFGIPSDTRALRALCDTHNILLIEDCAHIIPDAHGPKEVGAYGDIVLYSFGRDKAISGITGGAVIVRDATVVNALQELESQKKHKRMWSIFQLLCYPLSYFTLKPFYGLWIGKAKLWLLGKMHILPSIVSTEEKAGYQSPQLYALPNACAELAVQELHHLRAINTHRRKLTKYYLENCPKIGLEPLGAVGPDLPLQKFPLLIQNASGIRTALKKKNIYLHDGWSGCVICPSDADESLCGYEQHTSNGGETVRTSLLSLPTHPTMSLKQAKKLLHVLKKIL